MASMNLQHDTAPPSLASAGLPPRVRRTLERALLLFSEELDHGLGALVVEFERELFRLGDLARKPGAESGYMQALRNFRLNRADLVPRFMLELEASLAGLRSPVETPCAAESGMPDFRNLSLVEESIMDEDTVLREIASRQENRSTLALHLLGQRFGVLAGAPAFDAQRLPLGPQALSRAMRQAAGALDIGYEARLLLYRIFDRQVMSNFQRTLDRLNQLMIDEGVLPALTFVPTRTRPVARPAQGRNSREAAQSRTNTSGREVGDAAHRGQTPAAGRAHASGPAPSAAAHFTAWPGQSAAAGAEGDETAAFAILRQLLSGRRALIGKLRPGASQASAHELSTRELVGTLTELQRNPPADARLDLAEIKRAVLARTRQQRGAGASLAPEDNDTFELLGLLFGQIESELRRDAPSTPLVRELQLPLLRLALSDRNFFLHSDHPARQLLNTIAESAARWLERGESDPQLLEPMRAAVAEVTGRFDGDPEVFAKANSRLQENLQVQVRKAEALERRHVEAARGKEKLEIAKLRASRALEQAIEGRRVPRFTHALLNQAWSDVLTLTLLRNGEESEAWRRQQEVTEKLVTHCVSGAPLDVGLMTHVETSLAQVGYHADEARVIAERLTGIGNVAGGASRTELAMKLKSRVRLGENRAEAARPKLPPRTPAEQAQYEQLRVMPFGVWIEFVLNQQGDVARRRLSWYSPITDNALFVNQRGQRVSEISLDRLSRMLTNGQAQIVTTQRARLVDRAWSATIGALRSFAGHGALTTSTAGGPGT